MRVMHTVLGWGPHLGAEAPFNANFLTTLGGDGLVQVLGHDW